MNDFPKKFFTSCYRDYLSMNLIGNWKRFPSVTWSGPSATLSGDDNSQRNFSVVMLKLLSRKRILISIFIFKDLHCSLMLNEKLKKRDVENLISFFSCVFTSSTLQTFVVNLCELKGTDEHVFTKFSAVFKTLFKSFFFIFKKANPFSALSLSSQNRNKVKKSPTCDSDN